MSQIIEGAIFIMLTIIAICGWICNSLGNDIIDILEEQLEKQSQLIDDLLIAYKNKYNEQIRNQRTTDTDVGNAETDTKRRCCKSVGAPHGRPCKPNTR